MDDLKKQFAKIYDKNVDAIYRFVFFKVNSEEIAQDLTSEAFMKSWQVFQKEGLKIENPRAFVYRTARNLVIDYYRKKARMTAVSIDDISLPEQGQCLEEKIFINSDFEQVKKALQFLREDYQSIITMHYIEGMSSKEISKVMKRSEGAIRVLLHRALNSLKQEIKEA
ncbi:MAG: sigma-70 family RNA polymerase sigma factor [Candidatus Pacebacteria bacterium]|nr:sigma-70 family RNA polymerase sigma factor [Candidatus Paceibacterota bacterium]MDD5446048.1 sigma-70 family RNA polymerase sigma factor [Candidatus Paceibacterota bacterium]